MIYQGHVGRFLVFLMWCSVESVCTLTVFVSILCLLFYPADGCKKLLRNVGNDLWSWVVPHRAGWCSNSSLDLCSGGAGCESRPRQRLVLLCLISLVTFGEECRPKLQDSSLFNFFRPLIISSLLGSNIPPPTTLFSYTLSLCSSLSVR
jgi:hypothetical protein